MKRALQECCNRGLYSFIDLKDIHCDQSQNPETSIWKGFLLLDSTYFILKWHTSISMGTIIYFLMVTVARISCACQHFRSHLGIVNWTGSYWLRGLHKQKRKQFVSNVFLVALQHSSHFLTQNILLLLMVHNENHILLLQPCVWHRFVEAELYINTQKLAQVTAPW